MKEKKDESLGAGDLLESRELDSDKSVSVQQSVPSIAEDRLLELAKIGQKAHINRKESNENTYINIEQFFTERNVDKKYVEPFRIYMRHQTYQHSIEDFDQWFDKFLNRFN